MYYSLQFVFKTYQEQHRGVRELGPDELQLPRPLSSTLQRCCSREEAPGCACSWPEQQPEQKQ